MADGKAYPTLTEATKVWARIGLLSFGGPAGQIALMHRMLVEERKWLGNRRFLHALNFCMVLPGPEAMQLAVYIGWLMHGIRGGLVAGLLFILPGAAAIMAISWVYALYGATSAVEALFFGLKAAVLVIVIQAVIRIGQKALKSTALLGIAASSFVAIFAFAVPFPIIILAAALIGLVLGRAGVVGLSGGAGHGPASAGPDDSDTVLGQAQPGKTRISVREATRLSAIFLALWLAPVAALLLALGPAHVFSQIASLFSVLAVVTFGGAYAVLAYLAQEAVQTYGWLSAGEMLDGLGMAETTPGPLIMVTQFVGFMGAFRDAGTLPPLLAGTLGGLLTTWVTFVPCFLWIFLGAPFSERLRDAAWLSAALTAVTAAVVGVILNLGLWFGMHVVFDTVSTLEMGAMTVSLPIWSTINLSAAGLVLAAAVAVFGFRLGTVPVLIAAALLGLALRLAGLA
jgi:chromate transporter